jgi:hypothetical protein
MASRAVDLEEKIDGLMALLQNQTAEKAQSHGSNQPAAGISTPASSQNRGCNGSSVGTPQIASPGHSDLLAVGESAYHQKAQFDILKSAFEPQPHQAENCLAYFRSHMLTLFPFVYLSPDMTARQLREWYPFLWVNIMAVTAKHVTGQEFPITASIKQFVAHKVVVDNDANLDLLLGLLVFICW